MKSQQMNFYKQYTFQGLVEIIKFCICRLSTLNRGHIKWLLQIDSSPVAMDGAENPGCFTSILLIHGSKRLYIREIFEASTDLVNLDSQKLRASNQHV